MTTDKLKELMVKYNVVSIGNVSTVPFDYNGIRMGVIATNGKIREIGVQLDSIGKFNDEYLMTNLQNAQRKFLGMHYRNFLLWVEARKDV